jgi:hypothetical protein
LDVNGFVPTTAFLGFLHSATSYAVRFALDGDVQASYALVSATGSILTPERPLARGRGEAAIALQVPGESTDAILYLYLRSARPARALVGAPSLTAYATPAAPTTWQVAELQPPHVGARRTAPGSWDVAVTGAPARYVLVLNDTFDPGWTFVAPGAQARHVETANGTNAWIVDGAGSYGARLQYAPGRLYAAGGIASACLFGVALLTYPASAWRLRR